MASHITPGKTIKTKGIAIINQKINKGRIMQNFNCIFTGGSSRGLCYVGVLKALEELNIEIDTYAGSSIGSLMAVFHAIGYSAEEIEKEVDSLNLCALFRDFNFKILSDFAFSKGNIYLNWLREKIERKYYGKEYKKGKMKPVCFKDIEKEIYVTATEFETSKCFVFSKYTTPDVEIAFALRASSSMPGLLKPVEFQNKILIDGDILRARPIWEYIPKLKEEKSKILEFRITGGNKNKISLNPIKLINSIVNVAAYTIDNNAVETYKNEFNILQIDIPNIDFTDFKFTLSQKKSIYKIGYNKTINYFVDK